MALVAYSDESDMEEEGEEDDAAPRVIILPSKSSSNKENNSSTESKKDEQSHLNDSSTESNNSLTGINSIVDEDDFVDNTINGISLKKNASSISSLLSSIPLSRPTSVAVNMNDDLDNITDVPTVSTWTLTKNLKAEDIKKEEKLLEDVRKTEEKPKNKRKKIQFIVPELSEFSDDEEEVQPITKKKLTPSGIGSGLLSALPQPSHKLFIKEAKRQLVPHILTKKPEQRKQPMKAKPVVETKSIVINNSYDSDEDMDDTSDFFSLSKTEEIVPTEFLLPEVPKLSNVQKPNEEKISNCDNVQIPEKPDNISVNDIETPQSHTSYNDQKYLNEEHSFHKDDAGQNSVDQEAIMKLVGRRGRKEVIDIIDINADDALLGRQEWMTKALTEEKPTHSFSKKKEDNASNQQKRKHQITFLAKQAQEREIELKNQWATNRMSKKITQNRYGF